MTNRMAFLCALALSLVLVSICMVPKSRVSPVTLPVASNPPMPIHSLTGVSFHAMAGF